MWLQLTIKYLLMNNARVVQVFTVFRVGVLKAVDLA